MSSSKYKGFCIAMVGTNGTGKTTWFLEVIKNYKRNVLVIMDDDSEEGFDFLSEIPYTKVDKFKGKGVCYPPLEVRKTKLDFYKRLYGVKELGYNGFGNINGVQKGGALFFDDFMTVVDSRPEEIKPLFKKRRQRKLDIFANCHGFSEFPLSLVKNLTHIVICKTMDSTDGFTARMNKELAEQLKKAVNYVNEKAKRDPYFKYTFDLKNPDNNKPLN